MTRFHPLIAALAIVGVTAGANLPSYKDGWGFFNRKGELSAPRSLLCRVHRYVPYLEGCGKIGQILSKEAEIAHETFCLLLSLLCEVWVIS